MYYKMKEEKIIHQGDQTYLQGRSCFIIY